MKDKAMHIGLVIINYMILYRLFQWFAIGISNHKDIYPVIVLFAPLVIVLPLSLTHKTMVIMKSRYYPLDRRRLFFMSIDRYN